MTPRVLVGILLLAGTVAGCANVTASTPSTPSVTGSVQRAALPRPNGSRTALAWVPNLGFVRGTMQALATLGRPLPEVPGRNRTVEACRTMVSDEAAKLGAEHVEAVSAGPDRQVAPGRYAGPVLMRITYRAATGYEVRMATLTCVVDRKGVVVDAYDTAAA